MDLVVANSREGYRGSTDSFVYWGTKDGLNTKEPLRLPTSGASRVLIADLNSDAYPEILITEGDTTTIYWNRHGVISPRDTTRVPGSAPALADIYGDGELELLTITSVGVEVRSLKDLSIVKEVVPISGATFVTPYDLDGDKLPELVVSRHEADGLYDTQSVVFWNSRDGFSPERTSLIATSGASGNAVGDLDGDGKPEVVFTNIASGHASPMGVNSFIYLGDKNGQYSASRRIELPAPGASVCVVADFDRDGYNDVAFPIGAAIYTGGTGQAGGVRIFWGGKDGLRSDRYYDLPTPNNAIVRPSMRRLQQGWIFGPASGRNLPRSVRGGNDRRGQ